MGPGMSHEGGWWEDGEFQSRADVTGACLRKMTLADLQRVDGGGWLGAGGRSVSRRRAGRPDRAEAVAVLSCCCHSTCTGGMEALSPASLTSAPVPLMILSRLAAPCQSPTSSGYHTGA